MVRILYSFSSDDSTVCALDDEKETEEDQFTTKTLLLPQISSSTMIEIKDIEGNITRPPKKEEPPQVLHPYVYMCARLAFWTFGCDALTLTRLIIIIIIDTMYCTYPEVS